MNPGAIMNDSPSFDDRERADDDMSADLDTVAHLHLPADDRMRTDGYIVSERAVVQDRELTNTIVLARADARENTKFSTLPRLIFQSLQGAPLVFGLQKNRTDMIRIF